MKARLGFSYALLLVISASLACNSKAKAEAQRADIATDSVRALQTQMQAVDDSIGTLLGEFESSSGSLERMDSTRSSLEAQATRVAQVNEKLAANAPSVYARLSGFVEQHKGMLRRITALDDTIAGLRARIRTLESRNSALRTQVASLKSENTELRNTIDRLLTDSATRSRKIAQLDSSRTEILERTSRAYVMIASKDSLSKLGIAGKTNFLRLGPTVLKKFDRQVFRLVDTRRDTVFRINSAMRALEVLSTHPNGSYKLVEIDGSTELRIVDVDSFWSVSRTLTVMTNR